MKHTSRSRQVRRQARAVQRCYSHRPVVEELESRCLLDASFSLIDETNNNPDGVSGTAGTDLRRVSPAAYKPVANGGDGLNTPSMTYGAPTFVAGPRLVSNTVANQATTLFGPTDINTVNQNGLSDFGYTWGQFLDHDMDLTPDQTGLPQPDPNTLLKDGDNGFPIPVDPVHAGDPIGSLAFSRSVFNPATGITTPRQQPNVNTAFLDLSQVYGSTQFVSDALRVRNADGSLGYLLKSSPGALLDNPADNLLPFNNLTYFSAEELAALNMANANPAVASSDLFAAGDVRANETIELTSLHTLFMRNHNAIATQLHLAHLDWTDQHVFDEARMLNIAEEQRITYEAYLPALLGPTAILTYGGYNPGLNPSISTEFSTVAFRFGHSLLNNLVARDNNDGSSIGTVLLAESFFNPSLLTPGVSGSSDIGAILKGDADNSAQAMDVMAVSAIRNLLFGQGGPGEDLIARDLWRADDHGIGTYNDLRFYFGLPQITDTLFTVTDPTDGFTFVSHGFEQITSNVHVQRLLSDAFTGPTRATFLANGKFAGDINPFIAGLAEDHVAGSDLGPLFHRILVDQFTRLRDGDHFFYLNQVFNAEEQAILDQGSTLGQIITARTGITNLQADVFRHLVQEGGQEKGYYTHTQGQAELTGAPNGATLTTDLYNSLVAALANPNVPGYLVLVDADGNYLPTTFLQTYSNVKSYLQNSSGNNMAFKLSLQLLTTEFNVLLGKVNPATSIFVPGITVGGQPMSFAQQDSLRTNGVTNPSGIVKIQDLLDAAIAELAGEPFTLSVSPERTFEEALKNCFEAINNNETIFILL